jgi:hypothetical protein
MGSTKKMEFLLALSNKTWKTLILEVPERIVFLYDRAAEHLEDVEKWMSEVSDNINIVKDGKRTGVIHMRVCDANPVMKEECFRPCPFEVACSECEGYWDRMVNEGFFEPGVGWSQKALREAMKF